MKENRAFRILFIAKKQQINRQALKGIFLNPNTKYTEVPQSSVSAHHFFDVLSFSKISQPPG